MNFLRATRAVGGLLSIVVLLGLVAADFYWTGRALDWDMVVLLLGLVSALLGVDVLRERLPVNIQVGGRRNDERNE